MIRLTVRRPGWLRALLGAALVVLAASWWGGVAFAHAVLQATTPSDGARLEAPPDEVSLQFSEPVGIPPGGVRVYDSDGGRVEVGEASHGDDSNVVRVGLRDSLPTDSYIVTWRAVSADGHPVKGAFVFSVGEAGAVDDSLVSRLFAAGADRPYAVAASLARWLAYTATLLAAGAVAFVAWVAAPALFERERPARVGVWAAAVGVVAAWAGIPLQSAQTSGGGLAALVRPDLLGATVLSSVGAQTAVQSVGLAIVALALLRPRGSWFRGLGLAGGAVGLGSLLLSGHTRTVEPIWLMVVGDAVHLVAAAVWFGGLVLLTLALRARRFADDPLGAARLVSRFSLIASWAVAGVLAGGLAQTWALVRALRALVSTVFGWTLLAKVALAAGVMAVGAYNNRRLVPVVARAAVKPSLAARAVPVGGSSDRPPPTTHAAEDAEPGGPGKAWRTLGRTVRWEVGGLVAVLAVTSALVYLQPASEAAGITAAYSTYVDLGQGRQLNLVVDPNRAGFNEIHLYVLDPTGRPAPAQAVTLELFMPSKDIGPITRSPQVAGPGHWIYTGDDLSIPGAWEIGVVVGLSEFAQLRATVPVTLNP